MKTTNETKHTPTPWARNINHKYPIYSVTSHAHIAYTLLDAPNGIDERVANANLEFIVRAVNAHDELVEVLRGLVVDVEYRRAIHKSPWYERAVAALAKAEGK